MTSTRTAWSTSWTPRCSPTSFWEQGAAHEYKLRTKWQMANGKWKAVIPCGLWQGVHQRGLLRMDFPLTTLPDQQAGAGNDEMGFAFCLLPFAFCLAVECGDHLLRLQLRQ